MSVLTFTGTLTITKCGVCSVPHAIPKEMYDDRLANGGNWYCPNGHYLHFTTTKADRLASDLARAQRQATAARASRDAAIDQADAAERSKRALKGHLTRARNKIAAGVCPVPDCQQHFANVREHMKFKHPDYTLTDPETGQAIEP